MGYVVVRENEAGMKNTQANHLEWLTKEMAANVALARRLNRDRVRCNDTDTERYATLRAIFMRRARECRRAIHDWNECHAWAEVARRLTQYQVQNTRDGLSNAAARDKALARGAISNARRFRKMAQGHEMEMAR